MALNHGCLGPHNLCWDSNIYIFSCGKRFGAQAVMVAIQKPFLDLKGLIFYVWSIGIP